MIERSFERYAATRQERFALFVRGKQALEGWEAQTRKAPLDMQEADHRRAREHPLLTDALDCFIQALRLCEGGVAHGDAAVARYQIGRVHEAWGDHAEALRWIGEACDFLRSGPVRELRQASEQSSCLYHLGVINLKLGKIEGALTHLLAARRIDSELSDLPGVSAIDRVIQACAEARPGAEALSPGVLFAGTNWVPTVSAEEIDGADTRKDVAPHPQPEAAGKMHRQRLLILVASYGEALNDVVMSHLSQLGQAFGRPVAVARVAFGSEDPAKCRLPAMEPDQHLCAAVLVIERAALLNPAFLELAGYCIRSVASTPDFRFFVCLEGMTVKDLWDFPSSLSPSQKQQSPQLDNLIESLFATTQVAQWSSCDPVTGQPSPEARTQSLQRLARELVSFIRAVERLAPLALWRRECRRFARLIGKLAFAVLCIACLHVMASFVAGILQIRLHAWLEPWVPALSIFAYGTLVFPLNAPLLHLLLRGSRATTRMSRDQRFMSTVFLPGVLLLTCGGWLLKQSPGLEPWLYPGLLSGLLLDVMRRNGFQASRHRMKLSADNPDDIPTLIDPKWANPELTVRPLNRHPSLRCRILPILNGKVFISYSQRSEPVAHFAAALYHDLRGAGVSAFLDRASIPTGANWLRELDEHLARCDAFVCILDEHAVQSRWVAAELLAALQSRHLASTPEILLLIAPTLTRSHPMLPVFQSIVPLVDEPQMPGQPQMLRLSAHSRAALTWGLSAPRFQATSIFPPFVGLVVGIGFVILHVIGSLGMLGGLCLALPAALETLYRLPLSDKLLGTGHATLIAVLLGYLLGFAGRTFLAVKNEPSTRVNPGSFLPAAAVLGFSLTLALLVPKLDSLGQGWAMVSVVAGWLVSASIGALPGKDE